ncbi:MAG: crotonase/enoyl-CoA hydratase family protein [Endozoicomonas sp. (ex Botrylloides leachii)]|nr:crotonase/enoyl-CoA hydratase family protein [Endozoicomonas sp. (ex Botrylloides leachii)]
MQCHSLRVCVEAGIATITLNRPSKRNALNIEFWQEFPEVIDTIDHGSLARVIVIAGEGSMFCSGIDLSVFRNPSSRLVSGEPGRRSEDLRRTVLQLQAVLSKLENTRLPVLAAIHGGCIGGGLNLICACDCRYSTADAYFSLKETQLGMTADLGVLQRLPSLIPNGLARELAYTGRKIASEEAFRSGLLNQVFADQEAMMKQVYVIAEQIASNSPLAVTGSKEMLNYARDHSVADSLNYMATWQSAMFQPNEVMKAMQAKAQKKSGEFDNLWPVKPPLS